MRTLVTMSCLLGLLVTGSQAADFHVDTDIYVGQGKSPVAKTLTVFLDGKVYDFLLTGPQEITIFEPTAGAIHLIDPRRKVRATLTTRQLQDLLARVKVEAIQANKLAVVKPEVKFEFDAKQKSVRLLTERMRYHVKGKEPRFPEAVAQYREFADWIARLNAIRDGFPPFIRTELNRQLAERGWLPQEVERVAEGRRSSGRTRIRSHHIPYWTLTKQNRKRVTRANAHLVEFELVTLANYMRARKIASRPQQTR